MEKSDIYEPETILNKSVIPLKSAIKEREGNCVRLRRVNKPLVLTSPNNSEDLFDKLDNSGDDVILVKPEPSPTKAEADTVPEVCTKFTEVDPNCIVLLDVTIASAPIAAEFVSMVPEIVLALWPINVFLDEPEPVNSLPEFSPTATLWKP